jgi:hypothetical protein
MITINLNKAKEIKKQVLRKEREPLLQALDVQFQRAMETNSDTTEIVQSKQILRDVTDLVDACTTLEEIDSVSIPE